jgi:hypothetical protein
VPPYQTSPVHEKVAGGDGRAPRYVAGRSLSSRGRLVAQQLSWNRRVKLEPGALALLVAGRVAATGGGWVVRLALQVLGDPVVLDHQSACVLVGL